MRFNAIKCYILRIKIKAIDSTHSVQNNPYLGMLLSKDLKWSTHITNVAKKEYSTKGILIWNLRYCPQECKKPANNSLVRSTMGLCSNSMEHLQCSRFKNTETNTTTSYFLYNRQVQDKKRWMSNKHW